jgi:heme/copper-type cytochrome/quinol oxidase subunit 2
MSSKGALVTGIITVVSIIILVLVVFGVTYHPAYGATRQAAGAVTTVTNSSGQKVVHVNLNIVVAVGTGPHADWLGYQTQTNPPHPGPILDLPRNTLVTVDIHNYDSQAPLRNYFFTQVQGTVGEVAYVNGKPFKVMNPNLTSHTFTIPSFGVSVPMQGLPSNAPANKFVDMRFTFRTPNTTGVYRWQCFVPCGSGLYGNGGPMGQIGYMSGLITLT